MANLTQVTDYIIKMHIEQDMPISPLKLQKLLYYVQAWHLAFYDKPIMDAHFEAWVHGPVCRDVYNRFRNIGMYNTIQESDLNVSDLSQDDVEHIDSVLEVYAKFSATQLEELTHAEQPWIEARSGYKPAESCDVVINESSMQTYYKARLTN